MGCGQVYHFHYLICKHFNLLMKSDVSKQNDVETIPTGDVNITNRVLNDYYKLEDAVSFSNVYLFLSYSFYSLKVL